MILRICIVSQNASPGLLIFRRDFIMHLIHEGHQVYAFANDYDESSVKEVEAIGAIAVSYSLNKTGLNPFMDLIDIFKLYRQFKAIDADVVLSSFVKPSIYATIASAVCRVPRRIAMLEGLGYIHTSGLEGKKIKKELLRRIHGLMCTIGYYFAHKVVFLNHDDPKDLRQYAYISYEKITVLGAIGLKLADFPFSEPSMSNPIRFIFIARLLKEKGIREFIDAARIVRSVNMDVEFVILGGIDPANPSSLSKGELDTLLSENLVSFPGHVSSVVPWLSDSHVFVLPSYREGFPRSTQEAMATGRAVITTDVPGCRDCVVDERNGFLVRPQSATDLAEKMLMFVDTRSLVCSMGLESHKIAKERFDVHKVNRRLLDIIKA